MSNLTMWTFPHYEVRVEDLSIYTPVYREQLPLHRPVFFMRMQKGPIGVPVWNSDINFANRICGRGTFDKNNKYHSRESVFAKRVFGRQGCFLVRLADDTAKFASIVLECHMTEMEVPQWERDEFGNYSYDTEGNRIPEMTTGATPVQVTVPGYALNWQAREMTADETLKGIEIKTVTSGVGGGVSTKVVPVLALRALYPGEYGNDLAFKLFYDKDNMEPAMADSIGSLTYMFQAMDRTYGQDTMSPVRTVYSDPMVSFSMKDRAIDTRLDKNMALSSVIQEQYYDNYAKLSNLPFSTYLYSDNVKLISDVVAFAENDLDGLEESGWMFNILNATTMDGIPLKATYIATTSPAGNWAISLNKNYLIYLKGGSDGDISDEAIETLTRQYLMDDIYPDLADSARYPITHVYDTGVALETKKALIEFLGYRDDVKVILSTQDCNRDRMNIKDEDMSVGASLHAACILQPESQVFGTEVCRAEIYQQAGYLNDSTIYDGILPATLDALAKRCRWQSRGFIEGMPKGIPGSEVTMFREWNWTPSKPEHKQKSWDTGLNYFQYYDMTRVHYADIRSVYRYDTSVLSSAIFTDAVVYAKHVVRYNWSILSGLEIPFARLAERAKTNVLNDMLTMLNNMYGVDVEFYQTAEEAKIGYISHAKVKLIGYAPNRVWIVDIQCYRDGYTPEA